MASRTHVHVHSKTMAAPRRTAISHRTHRKGPSRAERALTHILGTLIPPMPATGALGAPAGRFAPHR